MAGMVKSEKNEWVGTNNRTKYFFKYLKYLKGRLFYFYPGQKFVVHSTLECVLSGVFKEGIKME